MTARPNDMMRRGDFLPVLLPVRRPAPRTLTLPLDAAWQRQATLAVLVLFALWLLSAEALAQAGMARPGIAALLWKWSPLIFQGFLFNILISVLSMAIGTVAGVALGLLQVSLIRPVRQSAWVITQFFRNAPWLVLLFYCILLIPFQLRISGMTVPFPAWIKAVIGLSLPVMAYVSEFVRGAVRSIPSGQWEAAESLAFGRFQTMSMIILPQCVKRLLPPWMNLYAILTMATPLVSVVGVQEAMTLTRAALSSEGRFDLLIPMYLYVLAWFFMYCYPISRVTVRLERRYGRAS
jgi:polar amino acid transport system permease protein